MQVVTVYRIWQPQFKVLSEMCRRINDRMGEKILDRSWNLKSTPYSNLSLTVFIQGFGMVDIFSHVNRCYFNTVSSTGSDKVNPCEMIGLARFLVRGAGQ